MGALKTAAIVAYIGSVLACLPREALAITNLSDDVKLVLEKNPQLRKAQDFPKIQINPEQNWLTVGEIVTFVRINPCSEPVTVHMKLDLADRPKCLVINFRGAEHSFESGYDKLRTYEGVLARNSPAVIRIYETEIKDSDAAHRAQQAFRGTGGGVLMVNCCARLIAEFDQHGSISAGVGPIFMMTRPRGGRSVKWEVVDVSPVQSDPTIPNREAGQTNPTEPSPSKRLLDRLKSIIPK